MTFRFTTAGESHGPGLVAIVEGLPAGLERASARETAARVAAGALAKELLLAFGVTVHSHVIQIGSVRAPERDDLGAEDFAGVDDSPVRCLDPDASQAMVAEIDRLRKA